MIFLQVTSTIQDDDVTSLAINISKIIVCLIMLFGINSNLFSIYIHSLKLTLGVVPPEMVNKTMYQHD